MVNPPAGCFCHRMPADKGCLTCTCIDCGGIGRFGAPLAHKPTCTEGECEHDNIERDPADPSVGIMRETVWCEDCGVDLTDNPDFERDVEGDYADDWRE